MDASDVLGPSHKREVAVWREGAGKSCFVDGREILGKRASGTERYCCWTWEDLDGWQRDDSHW